MYYICIENDNIISALSYRPEVPSTVLVHEIQDSDFRNIQAGTHYFDIPTRTIKEKTSELPSFEHHTHITEIPALVHGFYRRAKLERRPLDEIMVEDLDDDISKGNLTKEQASQILTLWIDYAKKHLPHAQYSGEY